LNFELIVCCILYIVEGKIDREGEREMVLNVESWESIVLFVCAVASSMCSIVSIITVRLHDSNRGDSFLIFSRNTHTHTQHT
jgi:hypothetical protein